MTAVAEKISALRTEIFFQERAALSSRAKLKRVMTKVRDMAPRVGDELP